MIDKTYKRLMFDKAAGSYEQFSEIQEKISNDLFLKFNEIKINPISILDLGCGTGKNALHILDRFKGSQIINFDFSESMLIKARDNILRRNQTSINNTFHHHHICGDIENLPIKENSIDLVWSSSSIQWSNDLPILFSNIKKILKPNGCFIFSTFGPKTLIELKIITNKLSSLPRTNNFFDAPHIESSLRKENFKIQTIENEIKIFKYKNVNDILNAIKGVGATNGNIKRDKGLKGRKFIKDIKNEYKDFIIDGLYPATYEVIYGVVWN